MRTRASVAALVCATVGAVTPAFAYFEETAVGARGVAMGAAASSMITDVSSYYWNPAGLAGLTQFEVLADFAKPYAVPDLNVGTFAVGGRVFHTGWAAAWHRLGITDVYSEDRFSIAAGRVVIRDYHRHQVAVGGSYSLGRIAFPSFVDPDGGVVDLGTQAKGTLDLGVAWTTPWKVDFAWVGRDLLQPRYQFVAGTGGDWLRARHELSAALQWNRESTVTLGFAEQDNSHALMSAGIEIRFYDVFAIRSGLSNLRQIYQPYGSPNDLQYNGGFGIYHRGYYLDAAATTNHDLGASYRVTLRVPVGGR